MRRTVQTDKAPAAIGPYSQGVEAGPFLFCAGQIALAPGGAELVAGGIGDQTRQVLENVRGILGAAGLDLRDVVKTTVFLADFGDFAAMNEVYAEFFPVDPPARSTVGVAALPKNALVEIEAVAWGGRHQGGRCRSSA